MYYMLWSYLLCSTPCPHRHTRSPLLLSAMPASALPLNVTPSSTPQRAPRAEAPPASPEPASTPTQTAPANGLPKAAPAPALKSGDISSPHELTAFVRAASRGLARGAG
jgi:hypothetical protein